MSTNSKSIKWIQWI